MKTLITSVFILVTTYCFAQTDSLNFSGYFRKRSADIELKLYQMALKNDIRAYRNDSLATYYTPQELQQRSTHEEVIQIPAREPGEYYDSFITNPFIPEKELAGLGFHTVNTYPAPGSFLKNT